MFGCFLLLLLEAAIDGHRHARGAEATLGAMKRGQTLVNGMKAVSLIAQAFSGGDGASINGAQEHQTGSHSSLLHLLRLWIVA